MKIVKFDFSAGRSLDQYSSQGVTMVQVARGVESYRISCAYFEAGGTIGQHLTGMPQVFMVVAGSGWVSGKDGERVAISTGEAASWGEDEQHESGTDDGMTVVIIQAVSSKIFMPPAEPR